MALLMGKTIQKLRKDQGMTQEQVAATLGVSTAAVSKWETDSTYPDISLLSPLARLLKTNVDRLVNFKGNLSDSEVARFEKDARSIFEKGNSQEAMTYCQSLLREYPNDDGLKFRLASLYMFYLGASSDEELANQQLTAAIRLFEALRSSETLELRHASLHVLAGLYMMNDELDKAEQVIEELPNTDYDTRMMKTNILFRKKEFEESLKLSQMCIFQQVRDISLHLYNLVKIARNYEQYDKAKAILEIGIELDKLLHMDRISGLNANYYLSKAEISAIQGDTQAALLELEQFIPALKTVFALNENLDDLLFDKLELKDPSVSPAFIAKGMADLIEHSEEFQSLLTEERFKTLLMTLRELK